MCISKKSYIAVHECQIMALDSGKNGAVMALLEMKNESQYPCFISKVDNVEFIDLLGTMDMYLCNKQKKRDKILAKMGRKMFKKHSQYKYLGKNNILKLYGIENSPEIFTQEEIDQLLTANKDR